MLRIQEKLRDAVAGISQLLCHLKGNTSLNLFLTIHQHTQKTRKKKEKTTHILTSEKSTCPALKGSLGPSREAVPFDHHPPQNHVPGFPWAPGVRGWGYRVGALGFHGHRTSD